MQEMKKFQRAMTATLISFLLHLQIVAGCIFGHLGINLVVYEELKYKMLFNHAVSFLLKLRSSELEAGSSRRQPFWILFYLLLLYDLIKTNSK